MAQKGKNRAAAGMGNIRKKTVTRNGVEYTYWEGRCTVGYDPGTGKQIQRSVSGKTQKEVTQKVKSITKEIDDGVYLEPCKLTVGEWLTIWQNEYLVGIARNTVCSYKPKSHYPRTRRDPAFQAHTDYDSKVLQRTEE